MFRSILFPALATSFAVAAPSMGRLMTRLDSRTPSFISAGYYPGSDATASSLSSINWEKYNLITWASAVTTPDPSVLSLDLSGESLIPTFVQLAKKHSTMASISIGGCTGSGHFSTVVSAQNRSTFAKAILDMASKYDLDGVDFDWEYPDSLGIGCNKKSSADTKHFMQLLQEIRADSSGKNLYLSAAVGLTTFIGYDGNPSANLSGFAAVLDHVTVKAYDINPQWSTGAVGPNSPLSDTCSNLPTGSAIKGLNAWVAAGFPADKIVLGIPAYGHSFNVTPSQAIGSDGKLVENPHCIPISDSGAVDQCGAPERAVDAIAFSDMITQGFLNTDGTPANGIYYLYDSCSQTPYAYNETKKLMVSYDDPTSYIAKGKFVIDNHMLGFSMWNIADDFNGVLIDAITQAVNF